LSAQPLQRLPSAAIVGLALALMAALALAPRTALADAPVPLEADPGKCVLCHEEEVQDWQTSPHAGATTTLEQMFGQCQEGQEANCTCLTCHSTNFDSAALTYAHAGVTCEACHGEYVEGHPENGQMILPVDSEVCSSCHVDTYADWQHTAHADAGIQCIGCHKSHTQNLRLDDEVLCKSCHRDRLQDAGHLAHVQIGINCIDCHTSPGTFVATGNTASGPSSPSHDFAVVTEACAACHGETFHDEEVSTIAGTAETGGMQFETTGTRTLNTAVEPSAVVAEQDYNRRTAEVAAVSFGLGAGLGGLIGVIFVLVIGVLIQRPWRSKS